MFYRYKRWIDEKYVPMNDWEYIHSDLSLDKLKEQLEDTYWTNCLIEPISAPPKEWLEKELICLARCKANIENKIHKYTQLLEL